MKLKTKTFHGETNCAEYKTWRTIKQRCHNPNHTAFEHYSGNGIKVCVRWRNSYLNFLKDMGRKPTPEHTIERVNNSKGYNPNNCKWATRLEQSNNTSFNVFIELNGVKKTIHQWSRDTGIHYKTITYRIRQNWHPIDILTPAKHETKAN